MNFLQKGLNTLYIMLLEFLLKSGFIIEIFFGEQSCPQWWIKTNELCSKVGSRKINYYFLNIGVAFSYFYYLHGLSYTNDMYLCCIAGGRSDEAPPALLVGHVST